MGDEGGVDVLAQIVGPGPVGGACLHGTKRELGERDVVVIFSAPSALADVLAGKSPVGGDRVLLAFLDQAEAHTSGGVRAPRGGTRKISRATL